ncbi:hypothetical protein BEWA_046330 [Theileria equi strain WA]|uniref:Uncharacterized protein n=1 Tax=Theileria equi strain WA TaxID=1537102 RepID=L1LA80_THEEQ|nr:hypothetical protein BEWA_046330 [Theileria equi strain WA]EKX72169.1 hypothetical protein BEWA_046330 [Theileria equi strain WA]|eukprot:XP_004831621.1 hypothetical protein BEWA_046330 [Theileria equi strain WA]
MSGGIRLDIDPKSWSKIPEEITCEDDNFPGTYDSYKYYSEPGKGKPFILSALLHKESVLKGIIPYPVPVKVISTYFNGDKTNILFIHIALSSGTNWYCANPDTKTDLENNILTRFISESKVLCTNDIENILQNVETHNGFSIAQLNATDGSFSKKLLGDSDIIFDLTEKPSTSGGNGKYDSEYSGTSITVTPGSLIGGTFKKIQHNPTYSPFCVKDIQLSGGQYMKVKGGLPNDLITGFYVYYKDSDYTTPLLVELNISLDVISGSYVTSRYLLSKNTEKSGKGKGWDIRKIGSYIEEGELKKVIQSISDGSKLNLTLIEGEDLKSKLGDINKGITIDITRTFEQTGGIHTKYYDSDGVRIPYKTLKSNAYYVVQQPYFPSFILKGIKTESGSDITGKNLHPPGTEIWQLNIYFKEAYKDPVLIEVICKYEQSDGCPKYVYYYCKDGNNTWNGYLLSTQFKKGGAGEDFADTENLIRHVKQNADKVVFEKLEGNLKGRLTKYPPDPLWVETQEGKSTEERRQGDDQNENSNRSSTLETHTNSSSGLGPEAIAGISSGVLGGGGLVGVTIWKWPTIMSSLITRL